MNYDVEDFQEEIVGKRIVSFSRGEGGFHIDLDDDKTIVILGPLAIIYRSETPIQ